MGVPPTGRCDGGGRNSRGRDLHLPLPEHSCTVNSDQLYYIHMYSSGETPRDKGVQLVVGTGGPGIGGDAGGGSGGGTGEEGGGGG